jgi:hypothetical protein
MAFSNVPTSLESYHADMFNPYQEYSHPVETQIGVYKIKYCQQLNIHYLYLKSDQDKCIT